MARKKPAKPEQSPPPPLVVVEGTRFSKDLQRQKKRGRDMSKFKSVIIALANRRPLEPRHHDHALTGNWVGYRDCHIEPDWVLIYQTTATELRLERTGTHSDLGL